MSLKLYFAPGACSFVPHVLLEAAQAEFEPVMIRLHKGEQNEPPYLAVNPRAQVPTLVDDGQIITQVLAIVGYIADRFPQMKFLPAQALARARVVETLAWMNNTVHPTFTHIFRPGKFAGDESVHAELKRHNTAQFRQLLGEIEALVAAKDAAGREFLGPDGLGPLDAYTLTLLRWGSSAGIDPLGFPATWAHVNRIAALPPVARAIERERLQLNLYKPAA